MDAFKYLLPSVQRIPDVLERTAVANDLAGYLGVDAKLVLDRFRKDQAGLARTQQGGIARQPAKLQVPALERILINAMLTSEETRREILPQLTPAVTAGFVTREIVDALLAQVHSNEAAGKPFSFGELDGRLSDPAKALLHEIATADEIGDDAACLQQARACLERLGLDSVKREIDNLRERVKLAERDGDYQEVLRLLAGIDHIKNGGGG